MTQELALMSHTLEEVGKWKKLIWEDHPFADRISLALTLRCAGTKVLFVERYHVLDEIMFLEGHGRSCGTKDAEQFRHGDLSRFWKKHFYASRHFLKNIGVRWSLDRNGNADLDKAIAEEQSKAQSIHELNGRLAYRIAVTGWEERVAHGLTGDWIIFAKCDGLNHYLDVATHAEGKDPGKLFQKLVQGCRWEFPVFFDAEALR